MTILSRKHRTQQEEPVEFINEGDAVLVVATGRIGRVAEIGVSPYYGEDEAGVLRAYVVSLNHDEAWTDWCLEGEVRLYQKATAAA